MVLHEGDQGSRQWHAADATECKLRPVPSMADLNMYHYNRPNDSLRFFVCEVVVGVFERERNFVLSFSHVHLPIGRSVRDEDRCRASGRSLYSFSCQTESGTMDRSFRKNLTDEHSKRRRRSGKQGQSGVTQKITKTGTKKDRMNWACERALHAIKGKGKMCPVGLPQHTASVGINQL